MVIEPRRIISSNFHFLIVRRKDQKHRIGTRINLLRCFCFCISTCQFRACYANQRQYNCHGVSRRLSSRKRLHRWVSLVVCYFLMFPFALQHVDTQLSILESTRVLSESTYIYRFLTVFVELMLYSSRL